MSATKELLLPMMAAMAGFDSVYAYQRELQKRDDLDREYDEYEYWKSIHDGTYFLKGYDKEEK